MGNKKENALELHPEVLADSDGEKEHHKRLERYSKAKKHQLSVLEYILQHEPNLSREARVIDGCSNSLIFRHWYTVNKYRLIGGCTCKKHLLCAMCALRRSAKTVKEVEKKIKARLQERPDLVPVLITFTVKNELDLDERYEFITKSKKKLLQKRRSSIGNKRLKTKSISRFIDGAFGSYEFKRGSGSGEWHPHSHEIALLEPCFEYEEITTKGGRTSLVPLEFQKEIITEWINITCDGSWSVDVKKLLPKEGQTEDENLMATICEASKYALKLNDIEIEDQIYAYKVLSGRRLTFSYGSLWGIKIPEDLFDDIESELELLPYVDLVYSFYSGSYNLTEVTDTGTTLVSPKSKGDKNEKKCKKRTNFKANRFTDQIKDYAAKVEKEDSEAFEVFAQGPTTLDDKGLFLAHLDSLRD